jgi:hypothetical protein
MTKEKSKAKPERNKRYRGGSAELKRAVRRECQAYVREHGGTWNRAHQKHLADAINWPQLGEAKKLAARLLTTLYGIEVPDEIRRSLAWLKNFPVLVPRQRIAINYARRGARWWWKREGPTSRDLAVLSLLAGNMPDLSARYDASPLEAIEQEERAMNEAKKATIKGYRE